MPDHVNLFSDSFQNVKFYTIVDINDTDWEKLIKEPFREYSGKI